MIVTYDEHGGFYDHVAPGQAVPPDDKVKDYDFRFDVFGVRVPTILVSPWLEPGVVHATFDHTSILRMLQKEWGLGAIGARVAAAQSPIDMIELRATPREDAPRTLPRPRTAAIRPRAMAAPEAAEPLNDNQRAIVAFSDYLEVLAPPPARERSALAARKFRGVSATGAVARDRALRFLRSRGANV